MSSGLFARWRTATFLGITLALTLVFVWVSVMVGVATNSVALGVIVMIVLGTALFLGAVYAGASIDEPYSD